MSKIMGGPSSYILLPKKITEIQFSWLSTALRVVGGSTLKQSEGTFDFIVDRPDVLGCSDECSGYSLTVVAEPEEESCLSKDDDLATIESSFGFVPASDLLLYAVSNAKENHRVLGALVVFFAERLGGIVAFNGAILPALPDTLTTKSVEKWDWFEIEPYFDEMVRGMPGKIVSIPYPVDQTRTWAGHYADVEFMKAWLKHPRFHMVK